MECMVCGSLHHDTETGSHADPICRSCQHEGWEIAPNGMLDRVEPAAEQPYEPNYEPYDDDILTEEDYPF